ncbi:unnamed protein product [Durusdinium trenchii]|uniref:C3H1-type domain-containing protein n=1 Tax=Durusdinium trenchii TaxID=1381693 RepID=A0ABP0PL99_9DINO
MADAQEREQVFELVVKQTFLEFVPSEPRTSLGLAARSHSAPPPPRSSEATEDVEDDSNQSASSYQAEKAEDTDHEGEHSIGSTSHRVGLCKPCAWYWKPGGCMNGAQCRHCHLCPHGELGRRKRMNRKIARNTRQAQADDPAPAQSLQSDSETAEPEPEMEVTSSEVDATPLSLFHAVPVHDGSSDRLGPHMLQAPGMPPLTHPPPMWRPGYGRAQTWSTTPSSARPSFVRRAQTWQSAPSPTPGSSSISAAAMPLSAGALAEGVARVPVFVILPVSAALEDVPAFCHP